MSMLKKSIRTIKTLRLRSGDVVMVRKWPEFTKSDSEAISRQLKKRLNNLGGVTLVFVTSFSDIRILDEAKMERSGWVRKR